MRPTCRELEQKLRHTPKEQREAILVQALRTSCCCDAAPIMLVSTGDGYAVAFQCQTCKRYVEAHDATRAGAQDEAERLWEERP